MKAYVLQGWLSFDKAIVEVGLKVAATHLNRQMYMP